MLNTCKRLVIAAAFIACACASVPGATPQPADGDALRVIVSACLDPNAPDYCTRCPHPIQGTCGVTSCAKTTDLWAETPAFVAIRDRKMCGCPPGFVHGLAIPRALVTGVEDPRRPNDIWAFAWQVALARIAHPNEIALVVNPPYARTQDELHVHIVRLLPQGRMLIEALDPEVIDDLDSAWQAAAKHAAKMGRPYYGVAVVSAGRRGYLVAATATSPELELTQATCRRD
jgi:CDP-diacylglycerol pyrophosphatase